MTTKDNYVENWEYDIVIVGSGTAGLVAGTRSAELGADVAILEKAPKDQQGGHTRFSESFRVPSVGTNLEEFGYEFAVPDYTEEDFYADIMNQTSDRADEALATTVVENAGETLEWITSQGVDWRMEPLAVGYTAARTWFDGEEYVETLTTAATDHGCDVHYKTGVSDLVRSSTGEIESVIARRPEGRVRIDTDAVVLAAGDYGSSDEKRVRYYGPDYDAMPVRGSRHNTGEVLDAAESIGARLVGQWGGAHMALIDADSPPVEGGANRVDGYQYGLLVNNDGDRFVDEGEDARAHTYAKFGRRIFEQPDHTAYIVLDAKAKDLARATGPSDPVQNDDLRAAFVEAGCPNPDDAVATVTEFNEETHSNEFEPEELDGNAVEVTTPPKSNWAVPIDEAPYHVYAVTGGLTFSFGGVAVTPEAEVLDVRQEPIPGVYAAGNCTGGLFFDNYPGGTAQTNAAVYGKVAAEAATNYVRQ